MSSDQYNAKTEQDAPLQDKVAEVEAIVKKVGTSMLTTVGTDGKSLHSRAMRDASHDKLIFSFIYDNTSHKEDEIHQDSHVNISFVEPTGGDWISIAGTASSTNDREAVKKAYSPSIKAWFGDLGDGKHDGSENDPRVAVMTVKPYEIRYYTRKQNLLTQAVNIAASAVSGGLASPGNIRTITKQEIESL
jgi:general stress protein 26